MTRNFPEVRTCYATPGNAGCNLNHSRHTESKDNQAFADTITTNDDLCREKLSLVYAVIASAKEVRNSRYVRNFE